MSDLSTTALEKESLEAHVDLCALRYQNLDKRLNKVEMSLESMHRDIKEGNSSLIKVIVGAAATITTGLLSTILVILLKV